MRHEQTYHGRTIAITTVRQQDGRWTATTDVDGVQVPSDETDAATYDSESEAQQASLSSAAAAIDRARVFTGKR